MSGPGPTGRPDQGEAGGHGAGRAGPPAPALGHGRSRIERAQDPRGALLRLGGYLLPYRSALIAVLAMVVVATLMELLGPWLFGLAIDRFIRPADRAGLIRLVLLLLAIYATDWVTQYGQQYVMASVSQSVLRVLRRQLFAHLQTLSLGYFDRRPIGEVMSRFTNDIDVINQVLSQSVIELVGSVLMVLGIIIAMFLLSPWLALGALTILPLMLLLTGGVTKRTRSGFRQVQADLGTLNGIMEEQISGARVVQAFGQERGSIAQFQRANIAVRDASVKAQTLAMALPPLLMVLSNVDIAVIAGLGGFLALRDLVSVGTIATFIVYARRFFRPLRSLAELYNSIQSALAGAERVFEALDAKPLVKDEPGSAPLDKIEGWVEFVGVDFAYVKGEPVLHEISFNVEPGQMVALVGPTGAGKTTVVNLLSRFYDVDAGGILVDGHDLRAVTQDSLRRQLGIVLQDTYLFSDTVMENIRYGRLEATDAECIAAAELAYADQFIRRLPQGYETLLSEGASNLSHGQRQLLAIARAALAAPRILVLDEATSNVDTRTEAYIQQALLKLMEGRTSFVIAHRLSTIRDADLVLVVRDGRIVERGTHESLMEQQGFYHRLYMSQYRGAAAGPPMRTEPAAEPWPSAVLDPPDADAVGSVPEGEG